MSRPRTFTRAEMSEFVHKHFSSCTTFIDSWGAGPFVIKNEGKSFRFEFSERFGPIPLRPDNEIDEKYNWPGRSPFWPALHQWIKGGKRVAEDGVTCVWDHLRPNKFYRIAGKHIVIVEHGDEDGPMVDVTAEMEAKGVGPTYFLDRSARNKSKATRP